VNPSWSAHSWRRRRQHHSKSRNPNSRHGVTSRKPWIFSNEAARTSNLALKLVSWIEWPLQYSTRTMASVLPTIRVCEAYFLPFHIVYIQTPKFFMAPSKSIRYADPQWRHNGSLRATAIIRPQRTYITLVQIVVNECLDRPN